jgi:ribosomal protein S18 acetylase RimI-like enzyme
MRRKSSDTAATRGVRYRVDAQARDVAAMRRLVAATPEFSPDERDVALELLEERLARGVASDYFFIFAEVEEELIGYVAWGPIPLTESSYDLYWIVVDPAHQRAGVGRRLLELTERAVAERGGGRVYIETSSREGYARTREFYLRAEYAEIARFEHFYAENDAKVVYGKAVPGVDRTQEELHNIL